MCITGTWFVETNVWPQSGAQRGVGVPPLTWHLGSAHANLAAAWKIGSLLQLTLPEFCLFVCFRPCCKKEVCQLQQPGHLTRSTPWDRGGVKPSALPSPTWQRNLLVLPASHPGRSFPSRESNIEDPCVLNSCFMKHPYFILA